MHRPIAFRIPDGSAVKMSVNESENELLVSDPARLYGILSRGGRIRPTFILGQAKYLRYTASVLRAEGYEATMSWRQANIF